MLFVACKLSLKCRRAGEAQRRSKEGVGGLGPVPIKAQDRSSRLKGSCASLTHTASAEGFRSPYPHCPIRCATRHVFSPR